MKQRVMKQVVTVAALCAVYGSGVLADCAASGYGTRLTSATTPTLSAAITGMQINANAPFPSHENWQEIHCGLSGTVGNLQKVGAGPADPVDPQQSVGTWTIIGDAVNYNYGTGGSFTWGVFYNGTSAADVCWQDMSNGKVIATGTVATAIACL